MSSTSMLLLVILYFISHVIADTRNVLLPVPDPISNGDALFKFWISSDDYIHAIIEQYNATGTPSNINLNITRSTNEQFMSVDADYTITSSDDQNILLSTSSRMCNFGGSCDWKIAVHRLEYVPFPSIITIHITRNLFVYHTHSNALQVLQSKPVAEFTYPSSNTNEIMGMLCL